MQPGGSVAIPASVSLNLAGSRPRSSSRRRKYGRSRSYGRSYSRGSRSSYYAKRASLRKAYLRGRWPSSLYAHPYIARGSAAARALGFTPGATYSQVGPEEQANRKQAGWYGKGDYMQGRGGYIGRVAGGLLGGLAGTAVAGGSAFASGGALAGAGPAVIAGGSALGAAMGDEFEDRMRARLG